MISSPFRALVLAPLALASVVACSAPPETTATSDEAISFFPPIRKYIDPAWPVANPAYCPNVYPHCSVDELTYADYDPTNFPQDAELRQLGCTPPLRLTTGTPNGLIADTLALCFDTPAVRAAFVATSDTLLTCNTCMPQAPAGQVYVVAGFAAVGPNCPSGCPNNGIGHSPVGSSGGTVSAQ